jgi:hypothetical protein
VTIPPFETPEYEEYLWQRKLDGRPNQLEHDALWAEVLKNVARIAKETVASGENRGSSQGPGLVGHKSLTAHLTVWTSDGRSKMHIIEARFDATDRRSLPSHLRRITTKVEVFWSDNDKFQQERLDAVTANPTKHLIVNHQFYTIGEEKRDLQGNLLPGGGFGGRMVRFKRVKWVGGEPGEPGAYRVEGEVEETRNLWFGGVIPPAWRDSLPDNAKFLGDFDGPTVMH